MSDHWCVMPWLNAPEMTWQAVDDLLAQSLPGVRVLLVDQGASHAHREWIDQRIDQREDHRVCCWHWNPAVPSLSAVWNRALRFVWHLGGTEALVVNNDVRLHKQTYEYLLEVLTREQALFVSAVGVREPDYVSTKEYTHYDFWDAHSDRENAGYLLSKGGPDFSCFLLSQSGHWKYLFDEQFIPAYHEDLDMHRRYMLGGDGDRIFSVNLPYLHYASGTIAQYTPEQRATFNKGFAACKAYYTRKWGPPNEEVYLTPFGAQDREPLGDKPVTTPDLQHYWQASRRPTDAPHDA